MVPVENPENQIGIGCFREFSLPRDDYKNIIQSIQDVTIPSISFPGDPELITGILDGTTYRLELDNGLESVTYCWNYDLPPGWEALGEFVKELIKYTKSRVEQDASLAG